MKVGGYAVVIGVATATAFLVWFAISLVQIVSGRPNSPVRGILAIGIATLGFAAVAMLPWLWTGKLRRLTENLGQQNPDKLVVPIRTSGVSAALVADFNIFRLFFRTSRC